MGEPVKIVDLARNLILLSGLEPDEDIKIEFTGVRPGEKLYEELSTLLEDSVPTGHESIRIYRGRTHPSIDALEWLDSVRDLCRTRDLGGIILAMKKIVPDYSPSEHVLTRLVDRPRLEIGRILFRRCGRTIAIDLMAKTEWRRIRDNFSANSREKFEDCTP